MKKDNDIFLLLSSILLFSITLGVCYNIKSQGRHVDSERQTSLTTEGLLPILQPLIQSGSTGKIVKFLHAFNPKANYTITKHIVNNSLLSQEKQDKLILRLALNFEQIPEIQQLFFGLLVSGKSDIKKAFKAAKERYKSLIPSLIEWMRKNIPEFENKNIVRTLIQEAIKANKPKSLAIIAEYTKPDKEITTDALWSTIDNNASPNFVEILADMGADLNSTHNGYTLAAMATKMNRQDILTALIETLKKQNTSKKEIGQHLSNFADPSIGSPLQIAIKNNYKEIEMYLRKYGALEPQ